AKDRDFILIQSKKALRPAEKEDLEEAGVELQEYLGGNTYLCRYEPEDFAPLQRKDYIAHVSIYLRELKGTGALQRSIKEDKDKEHYEVDCILHEAPGIIPSELVPEVAKAAGIKEDDLSVSGNKMRFVMHQDRLSDLAKLDYVNRIEQVHKANLANDKARSTLLLMAGDGGLSVTSSTYEGNGQTICVADTGLDMGWLETEGGRISAVQHPAFEGRVKRIDSIWPGDDGKDIHGHGTHVCASICGSGTYKDEQLGNVAIRGTAPAAEIIMQSLMEPHKTIAGRKYLTIPNDVIGKLFQHVYEEGVRIHSNSWTYEWKDKDGQVDYNGEATMIDSYIYGVPAFKLATPGDATAQPHEDFVVLMAAGNEGRKSANPDSKSQIGAGAAAKNIITVGASGSTRPNDDWAYVAGEKRTLSGINDTAIFSSRGPTKPPVLVDGLKVSGRIKPDVVAPGVAILSAASRALIFNNVRTQHGPSNDKDWLFQSGTSMSTPLVAGCVALLREALADIHGKTSPSAALIKALLVNGAVNFSNKEGPGLGYDYEQGFGRVVVDSSVAMIRNGTFVDGGGARSQKWDSGEIQVPASLGRCRLVATFTYPDAPGGALQNSMNLVVQSGGEARHGNMGRNGDGAFDNINNVEKVLWDNVPGSTFRVVVQVHNNFRPRVPASFAVAWDLRQ
ncbi:peptidase S8/S53 domain-containing protein, partial [Microdochium bolleyi]